MMETTEPQKAWVQIGSKAHDARQALIAAMGAAFEQAEQIARDIASQADQGKSVYRAEVVRAHDGGLTLKYWPSDRQESAPLVFDGDAEYGSMDAQNLHTTQIFLREAGEIAALLLP